MITMDGTGKETGIRSVMDTERARRRRARFLLGILLVASVAAYFVCITVGPVALSVTTVYKALFGFEVGWGDAFIVNELRAPRLMGAALTGAALSLAGLSMQALFRNPMASASVLGVSSGASFGAASAIAFGSGMVAGTASTTVFAFVMAVCTMLLVYSLAYRHSGGVQTTLLLLSGMAISSLFSGLTSLIEFFSDENTVTSIVFWILGSFDGCDWSDVKIMIIPVVIGCALLSVNAREMNLLTAGESKARALGVNVPRVRIIVLFGASLLVAGTVSICGVIGFVGLIIPHIFRSLVGPDHKRLIPLCVFGGALFLMIVDTFARTVLMGDELPVGVVTSILGAPFFIWILRSRKGYLWRS